MFNPIANLSGWRVCSRQKFAGKRKLRLSILEWFHKEGLLGDLFIINLRREMQNKFLVIQPWLPETLESIKREIRIEHLAKNPSFCRAHFGNRPLNRISGEELIQAYEKKLLSGDEELSQWVVNRWVFKNGDIYAHFAQRLEAIDSNYDSLDVLSPSQSEEVLKGALERFGAVSTYLFSVLNEVVFPPSVFEKLRCLAEGETSRRSLVNQGEKKSPSVEELKASHEQAIAKMQEKWEGKIAGILKKYTQDVEALKAQVRSLQKKLDLR